MNLFFEILTAIAILAIAASTVFYFVNIFFWPKNTVLWDQEEHELRRTVIDKWLHIGPMWAAFIGIWFCIYKGVIAVNNWIPSNWIGEDLIFTIAFLVSFFGALGLVSGMSKLLNLLLKYRIEIDRLQEVLKVLETGAALSSAEPEPEAKHQPATPREAAILKEYGYDDDDIALMPPEQRETEIREALDAGCKDPKIHSGNS